MTISNEMEGASINRRTRQRTDAHLRQPVLEGIDKEAEECL